MKKKTTMKRKRKKKLFAKTILIITPRLKMGSYQSMPQMKTQIEKRIILIIGSLSEKGNEGGAEGKENNYIYKWKINLIR